MKLDLYTCVFVCVYVLWDVCVCVAGCECIFPALCIFQVPLPPHSTRQPVPHLISSGDAHSTVGS